MKPTNICSCCNKAFDQHLMVECSICKKFFKNTCVDVTSAEVRAINANKGYDWSCKDCRAFGNDLKELKALIIGLRDEIHSLKEENSRMVGSFKNNINFEEVIAEINDRNSRKCNIVIFGVEEQDQSGSDASIKEDDKNTVINVINAICPNNEAECTELTRLGKYQSTKIRPIKVTLSNDKQVLSVIRNAKNLRNNRVYRNISISYDRTKRQIEYYKSLKAELDERRSQGEHDCKIKYFNGVPKIVSNLN